MQFASIALAAAVSCASFAHGQAPGQAKPPSAEERRAAQAARQAETLQVVAPALDRAGVESLLGRVGFEPLAGSLREAFDGALAQALEAYTACRAHSVDAPLADFRAALTRSFRESGMPAPAQAAQVQPLRAAAIDCDRRLIEAAVAAALGHAPAAADERLSQAVALRRADAAAATLSASVPGMTAVFLTVGAALDDLGGATGSDREFARRTLLGDGAARAEAAERFSFEWLNGSVFLAASTAIDVQLAARDLEAKGESIDSMQLVGIAMTIQVRGAFREAATLGSLDEAMVQALAGGLPVKVAHAMVDRLERASPGSGARQTAGIDIPTVVAEAIALPATTDDQRAALDAVLTEWMRKGLDRLVGQLRDEARLKRELTQRTASLSAKDPSTWGLDGAGAGTQQQQMAGAYGNLAQRRSDAEAAGKRIEAIVGPEAWASIAPKPMRAPRKANAGP